MLRLQQSQITLTQKDVDDYKRRSETKQVARLLGLPEENETCTLPELAGFPTLRQGAQRSRDNAVVHPSPSFIRSPVVGSVVDLEAGFGNVSSQPSAKSRNDSLAEKNHQRGVRRDSVLSHEESEDATDDQLLSHGSPKSSQASSTPSPPTRRNAVHGRRKSGNGQDVAKRASSRRYRPRSFSDPCEAPVLCFKPRRCPTTYQVIAEFPNRTRDLTINGPAPVPQSYGSLSSAPEDINWAGSESETDQYSGADTERVRHHSLPVRPLLPTPLFTASTPGAVQIEDSLNDGSSMWSRARNTSSPLEALGRDLSGLAYSGWTTELPVRSSRPEETKSSVTRSSIPETGSIPSEEASPQSPSPSRTISDDELSRPSTDIRNLASTGAVRRETSRWSIFEDNRRLQPGLSIGQGGRPRVGLTAQADSRPIRRRPVPNTEQENQDDLYRFDREREIRQARAQAGIGGVVEATPPPLGRLERFLS